MNASRICCGRQATRKHVFSRLKQTGVTQAREMAATELSRGVYEVE